MWILVVIAGPIYFAAVFTRETSKSQILRERFQALGLASQLKERKVGETLWISATRSFIMMFTEPTVFALAIYTSFAFAVIFVFFAVFPVIFQTVYGFDAEQVGLAYLSLFIGFVLSCLNYLILFHVTRSKAIKTGIFRVEDSLYSAFVGSVLLPIGLFW